MAGQVRLRASFLKSDKFRASTGDSIKLLLVLLSLGRVYKEDDVLALSQVTMAELAEAAGVDDPDRVSDAIIAIPAKDVQVLPSDDDGKSFEVIVIGVSEFIWCDSTHAERQRRYRERRQQKLIMTDSPSDTVTRKIFGNGTEEVTPSLEKVTPSLSASDCDSEGCKNGCENGVTPSPKKVKVLAPSSDTVTLESDTVTQGPVTPSLSLSDDESTRFDEQRNDEVTPSLGNDASPPPLTLSSPSTTTDLSNTSNSSHREKKSVTKRHAGVEDREIREGGVGGEKRGEGTVVNGIESDKSETKSDTVTQPEEASLLPLNENFDLEAPVSDEVVLTIPCRGGKPWPLTRSQLHRLEFLYDGVDIIAEAKKCVAYLEANPANKPTYSGAKRCLTNWLNNGVNRGIAALKSPSSSLPPTAISQKAKKQPPRKATPTSDLISKLVPPMAAKEGGTEE